MQTGFLYSQKLALQYTTTHSKMHSNIQMHWQNIGAAGKKLRQYFPGCDKNSVT